MYVHTYSYEFLLWMHISLRILILTHTVALTDPRYKFLLGRETAKSVTYEQLCNQDVNLGLITKAVPRLLVDINRPAVMA